MVLFTDLNIFNFPAKFWTNKSKLFRHSGDNKFSITETPMNILVNLFPSNVDRVQSIQEIEWPVPQV